MENKICKKCKLEKNINEFRLKKDKNGKYYYYSYCKSCEKEYSKSDFARQRKKEVDKKYREKHKNEINKKMKLRTQKMTFEEKEKKKIYNKNYHKNNKEKLNEKRKKYESEKRKNDISFKIKCQVRHLIGLSFNKKGLNKSKHTEEIIGISLIEFYYYLLQTFKNNYGYEWDGKEKVHIDHIIPLSTAETEEEIIKLCHYTNLQLLKAEDNLKKHNKLNWKLE